jgi:hypothetical protein
MKIGLKVQKFMSLVQLLRNGQCGVEYYKEYSSDWTDNELLENVKNLYCISKGLTQLPDLPKCVGLYCSSNSLTSFPELLECQTVTVIVTI